MTTDEIKIQIKELKYSVKDLNPANQRLLTRYLEVNVDVVKKWMIKEWLKQLDIALVKEIKEWRKEYE